MISVCNNKLIIEIGKHLQKLCSDKKGPVFLVTMYMHRPQKVFEGGYLSKTK